ncbi:MAG: hypothetical protein WC838_01530, partial [Candidatus Margulisiibacteriota bacterium]
MFKKTLLGITLLSMLTISALAVPNQLTYSGRLLQNGALVNSTLTMTFKIYDDPTSQAAGDLLWSTSNISVDVNQGIYSVVLDQVSSNVFSGESAYLEVVVGGEILAPRTRINSVGYALQAGGLSKPGGGSAVLVSTNGSIGIGAESTGDKLYVDGGLFVSGSINLGANTERQVAVHGIIATLNLMGSGQIALKTYKLGSGWLNRMFINNTGNIGIGTTNPQAPIDILITGVA